MYTTVITADTVQERTKLVQAHVGVHTQTTTKDRQH